MNLKELRESGFISAEITAGSHLYGLNIETSDKDIRGIFTLPTKQTFGFGVPQQINDEKNDIIFYEAKRFVELATKANPNILELLYAPTEFITYEDTNYELIRNNREIFLTQQCFKTFGGYAVAQIKKARGLNKKIVNPQPKERKTPLDFCYIINLGKSYPITSVYTKEQLSKFGVASNQNGKGLYCLYEAFEGARGVINEDESSNGIRLSSIPKDVNPLCDFWFNEDGYSIHCKQHKEYWKWVEVRNPARYKENERRTFDSKHMMHTFRLLNMGLEIIRDGEVNVYREHDRDILLDIRRGNYEYEYLVEEAEKLLNELNKAAENCKLPKRVDPKMVNMLMYQIREFNTY